MRNKIVVGNWKMNKTLTETKVLIHKIKKELTEVVATDVRILIAPSFVSLASAVEETADTNIEIVAQNVHYADNGAFTGEVATAMLTDIGVETVLLGHSERRTYFGETDDILVKKVNHALAQQMEIIFCFGECLEDRESGKYLSVIKSQLQNVVLSLEPEAFGSIILAYEPVWAIGTGKTASDSQVQEIHAFVRELLAITYTKDMADEVTILYGGSVKPSNAKAIFSQPDVDGGLIGGASLNAEDFIAIVHAINVN